MQDTSAVNITITVNGEAREVREGETITGLVGLLELDPERLAIELDRRIVKRAQWASTHLAAGAQLEIVQFVGGG
jgi:thiamine biosynthesis protein ThiS